MKNLLLLFLTIGFLSSCTEVYFEDKQPQKANSIPSFPEELQGMYLQKKGKDTLKVFKTKFTLGNKESVFNIDGELSDKTVLTKMEDYYFLNSKKEDGWEVIAIQNTENQITLYTIDGEDKKTINNLKEITKVKEVYSDDEIDYYLVNPTKEELQLMLKKKVFSREGTFKRI